MEYPKMWDELKKYITEQSQQTIFADFPDPPKEVILKEMTFLNTLGLLKEEMEKIEERYDNFKQDKEI